MVTASPYYFSRTKRVFDIVISGLLIVFLLPLFVIIGLIILITAGAPIFFTQKRLGQQKKPFYIIKFRTMYLNAEKDRSKVNHHNHAAFPMFKSHNDPRFVGFGKLFSQAGLDELPQLFNILKGEMSLVGPRPLPVNEAKQLSRKWDFRYHVKPGIFSEWSVCLERHSSLALWYRLDQKSLQHSNLMIEIGYITKTFINHFRHLLQLYF